MSKLVCHIEKNTKGSIFGLQKHEQRENKQYGNKDIDLEKSLENIDLFNHENINYKEKIERIIAENKTSGTKVKSNSIVMVSSIISSDKDFFKELNHSEQLRFFKENLEFYKNQFGERNIISANIHFDETTPHMHINFVPITTDGRLAAKDIINRNSLRQIQSNLPKYLANKGFDIQRGLEATGVKHMKTLDYKKQLTEIAKPLEELESMFRNSKLSKKDMVIAKENVDTIKTLLKGSLGVVELERQVNVLESSLGLKNDYIKQNDGLLNKEMSLKDNYKEKALDLERENKKIADIAVKSKKLNNVFFKTINQIKDPKFLNENGKKQVKSIVDDSQKEINDIISPKKSQTQSTSIEM